MVLLKVRFHFSLERKQRPDLGLPAQPYLLPEFGVLHELGRSGFQGLGVCEEKTRNSVLY